jgi:glycosyltransferase involved in cell wall biosynthesis
VRFSKGGFDRQFRTCLVLYPWSSISTNPTLVLLFSILSDLGFSIDVICSKKSSLDDQLPVKFHNVCICPEFARLKIAPSINLLQSTKRFLRIVFSPIHHLSLWRIIAKGHSVTLAIDHEGLLAAIQLREKRNSKLIYLSFELFLESEATSTEEFELSRLHEHALRSVDGLIIQDEVRRDLLLRGIASRPTRTVLLPVAPQYRQSKRTTYLHHRLGIPSTHKIILFQGSIYFWSGIHEWEAFLEMWPENWTLVVHSGNEINAREKRFIERLNRFRNFRFSDEPLTPDELPLMTSSSDVGLISYHPVPSHWTCNENLRAVGLSSGKFSYFMMCGIPVICNRKTNLSEIVKNANVGELFSTVEQSIVAIKKILGNYEEYSANASKFFSTRLNPELYRSEISEMFSIDENR